jgi:hypothetical protein
MKTSLFIDESKRELTRIGFDDACRPLDFSSELYNNLLDLNVRTDRFSLNFLQWHKIMMTLTTNER